MAVDWTKPIQTHDGRQARAIGVCTLRAGHNTSRHVRIVAVKIDKDREVLCECCEKGESYTDDMRIVNAPQRHVRWLNCYSPEGPPDRAHKTREIADRSSGRNRIACIRIEFEEGEGL